MHISYFSLSLVIAIIGASVVSADAHGANVNQERQIKNPSRISIALPTRKVKDKNGETIFNAPVPLKQKEVTPTKRRSVTTQRVAPIGSKQKGTKTSSAKKKSSVNSTLQRAREERQKRQAQKNKEALAAREHKFKQPSPDFLHAFKDARFNALGSIYLMQDTVRTLVTRYPKACYFLKTDEMKLTQVGSLVCENKPSKVKSLKGTSTVYPFGNGPLRIYFQYLLSNDLLVGADFEYKTQKEAKQKFQEAIKTQIIQKESFTEESGTAVDSPYWRISHGEDFGRYWTRIATNFNEGRFVEDEKEKHKAENIRMGQLVLGASKVSEMPETTAECRLLGIDKEENMYEYYGRCFGFNDTAHYQLTFDDEDTLETFILRPDSIGTLADVSSYLASRFGAGKRCHISPSDSLKVLVKEDITALDFQFTYINPAIQNATVYAGTCERPFIYESPRRLFFTNQQIQASQLDESYKKRKLSNQARHEREAARKLRKKGIQDYFGK